MPAPNEPQTFPELRSEAALLAAGGDPSALGPGCAVLSHKQNLWHKCQFSNPPHLQYAKNTQQDAQYEGIIIGPRSPAFDSIAQANPGGQGMLEVAFLLYLIASKRSGQERMLEQDGSIRWLLGSAAWKMCPKE